MLENYIKRFARLRPDTSPARWPETTYHRAPHKPILLLAVIDLFDEGSITHNLIEITPDLGELFTLYWARVMAPDRRSSLAFPFFHLSTEKESFWHLIPQPGKESILAATHQVKSLNQLREITLGARLDDELYALLCVEPSRNQLRVVLIEKYFAPELHPQLLEQGIINTEAYRYSQELLTKARTQPDSPVSLEAEPLKPAARDQGFRRAIVIAYRHRCTFCGIRMRTSDGHTVVDAAHIVPWSLSHNDDPRNGMALCKLCHWTFDEGLLSVSQKYAVLISPQLANSHNIAAHLSTLNQQPIIRPNEEAFWPDLAALLWHHKEVFRKR